MSMCLIKGNGGGGGGVVVTFERFVSVISDDVVSPPASPVMTKICSLLHFKGQQIQPQNKTNAQIYYILNIRLNNSLLTKLQCI